MPDWLYPANAKFYDVLSAFKEDQTVWPINSKVAVGDTVYIYLAAPYKKIGYICTVKDVDIADEMVKEYSDPYIKNADEARHGDKSFMLLGDIKSVMDSDNEDVSLASLKDNGLKGMLMGARKLDNNPQLQSHIREACGC